MVPGAGPIAELRIGSGSRRVFHAFPQRNGILHRFCTTAGQFSVALPGGFKQSTGSAMREMSLKCCHDWLNGCGFREFSRANCRRRIRRHVVALLRNPGLRPVRRPTHRKDCAVGGSISAILSGGVAPKIQLCRVRGETSVAERGFRNVQLAV